MTQERESGAFPFETGPVRATFQTTAWSKLSRLVDGTPEVRIETLSQLCKTYWRPIYAFLRTHFRVSDEEAKDLTQEFILWTLENGLFEKADRSRGCFRALLKTSLRNFATSFFRKEGSLKRGGGVARLPMDFSEAQPWMPPAEDAAPEEILDREWREALMNRAVGMLRIAYRNEGNETPAKALDEFYFRHRSYEEIARELKISPKAVERDLASARKRLGEMVADLVAETVTSPEDLQRELETLFG